MNTSQEIACHFKFFQPWAAAKWQPHFAIQGPEVETIFSGKCSALAQVLRLLQQTAGLLAMPPAEAQLLNRLPSTLTLQWASKCLQTLMSWSRVRDSILHLLHCSWLRFRSQEFLFPCVCLLLWRVLGVEEWWKQFLRILLHFNNVFLAPWKKKTSRRQRLGSGCGKAELSRNAVENESTYVDTFGTDDFKYLKWKWRRKKIKNSNSVLSGTAVERIASMETKKRASVRCRLSLLLRYWWDYVVQLSPVNERNRLPQRRGGQWWLMEWLCSPPSSNDITVSEEQQQQTMQNV